MSCRPCSGPWGADVPVEPPPTPWAFPSYDVDDDNEIVGLGADLAAGTLLAAYRVGLFPMPISGQLAWWSPCRRGVLPLEGLRVSRSLRRSCRRYEVRIDTAFDEVIAACADPTREHGWIDDDIQVAYQRLHRLGWAHSVEAWSTDTGELAGGLYGVAIGGLFAGESMFHREGDASKVALVRLVELLREGGASLLDVQWSTPHLESLGVVEVNRREYLTMLADALSRPLPPAFA